MTVHVRMKQAAAGLRVGEDAALDAETAKFLHASGKAWITGGDAGDLEAAGLACDEEVGPSVHYPPAESVQAAVEQAEG